MAGPPACCRLWAAQFGLFRLGQGESEEDIGLSSDLNEQQIPPLRFGRNDGGRVWVGKRFYRDDESRRSGFITFAPASGLLRAGLALTLHGARH
jgi:hypothetical protein